MREVALIFFLALAVVGVVVIGMQVTSILAVGEGHGLRGIGDLYDVLEVDPLAKWALVGVIVGAIGLVAVAVIGRAAPKATQEQTAAAEAEEGEGESGGEGSDESG